MTDTDAGHKPAHLEKLDEKGNCLCCMQPANDPEINPNPAPITVTLSPRTQWAIGCAYSYADDLNDTEVCKELETFFDTLTELHNQLRTRDAKAAAKTD